MGKKQLKKEQRTYFRLIWQGLVLAIVGAFCAVGVFKNGIGKQGSSGLSYYIGELVKKNPSYERIVQVALIVLFAVCVLFGLYYFIRGVRHISSRNTKLGKSLLSQAKAFETLPDLLLSIDQDLEEATSYGRFVQVGREWVLGQEAMRIDRIQGIFSMIMDNIPSIMLIDCQNIEQALVFDTERERDNAYHCLCSRAPEAVTGSRSEWLAFKGQDGADPA